MKLCRLVMMVFVATMIYSFTLLCLWRPGVMGWVIVICLAVAFARRGYAQLTACGTARWAAPEDCKNAGVLEGNGLIVGRMEVPRPSILAATLGLFNPRIASPEACMRFICAIRKGTKMPELLVRLSRAVHTAVFCPTGGGKGVSCVIPFLHTSDESAVVIDFKGENARITAEHRRTKFGHKIVLLDPFKVVTQTPDTLNPLEFIDKDSPFAIDDCREIAAAIVERKEEKGDGVHFLDTGEGVIAANCAMVVQFAEGEQKSLQTVCDVVSHPDRWKKSIEVMTSSDAWDGMLARMGGNLMHLQDRELASTLSTVARFLRFLSTPAIAASTRASSFNPSELLNGKTTVYLIIPPERATALSSLLRLWVGTLIRAVLRGGLQEKTRVNFVLDEAASLGGKMDQVSDALQIGRGYGLRMQLYYQDLGQLKRCWPDGADQTLLANCSQVYFGVNDNATAEYVSKRLGEQTIIVGSGGTNTGWSYSANYGGSSGGSATSSGGASNNWAQQARALLKPEEVMRLSPRIAITFTPGVPPIWTTLVRYYEEKNLMGPGWFQRFWIGSKMLLWSLAMLGLAACLAWCLAEELPKHAPNVSAVQKNWR